MRNIDWRHIGTQHRLRLEEGNAQLHHWEAVSFGQQQPQQQPKCDDIADAAPPSRLHDSPKKSLRCRRHCWKSPFLEYKRIVGVCRMAEASCARLPSGHFKMVVEQEIFGLIQACSTLHSSLLYGNWAPKVQETRGHTARVDSVQSCIDVFQKISS